MNAEQSYYFQAWQMLTTYFPNFFFISNQNITFDLLQCSFINFHDFAVISLAE